MEINVVERKAKCLNYTLESCPHRLQNSTEKCCFLILALKILSLVMNSEPCRHFRKTGKVSSFTLELKKGYLFIYFIDVIAGKSS